MVEEKIHHVELWRWKISVIPIQLSERKYLFGASDMRLLHDIKYHQIFDDSFKMGYGISDK